MSHKHWPHANFTHFQKNDLGYFWLRLPKVKVLVFLGHIWPRITTVKVFDFEHFWPRMPMVIVLFFPYHFWPRMQMVNFLFFLVIFGQGYQWWTVKVFHQRWKFLIFESFRPRVPMVEVFVFSLSYLAKDTNGESFVFSWPFLAKLPMVKVLVGLGHFWPMLLLLATLAMNTNGESYVCDLRFWATSGVPLYQTWVRVPWRQSLAPHCEQEFSLQGVAADMVLQERLYLYTGRQALARRYEYLVPRNGTC